MYNYSAHTSVYIHVHGYCTFQKLTWRDLPTLSPSEGATTASNSDSFKTDSQHTTNSASTAQKLTIQTTNVAPTTTVCSSPIFTKFPLFSTCLQFCSNFAM